MIDKLVTRFIDFQVENGILQDSDISVYRYGYTLMLELFMNICISVFLGVVLGCIGKVVFFLCAFIPLRSFCGGYHAKKAWQCIILSNVAVLGAVYVARVLVEQEFFATVWILVEFVSVLTVVFLAPVDSQSKRLEDKERIVYKKCAILIVCIEFLAALILMLLSKESLFFLIVLAHVVQGLSLIITVLKAGY